MTMQEKLKDYYTKNLIKQLFCFAIISVYDFIYSEDLTADDWLMENFGTNSQELKGFTGLGEEIWDYYPVNLMGYIKNPSEIKTLKPLTNG